ncbi:ferric reductase domain-containing protein (plasmid) [Gordonia polyisoprenivorans VH2]|uniref:Ferric reductase domain-containing protein n=1 Tax=Gordonia polyisoprenivorans (strain DSM 44266 / VH2) TaxID=1112204 RepID=H6N4Z3_GORPV|nr:ferric reductase-like transmembrane domain-containing protein [Gordonia polyisoprenivorans]AFA76038.1 ferric reductase domain-containing protein [Gordonia polyisoprenivorans VH2]
MTSPWLWYTSRACGTITLILLTIVVILGAVTAVDLRSHTSLTTVVVGLHRALSLGATLFLLTHISLAVADSYVDLSLLAVLVPFTAHYEQTWVGVGSLGLALFTLVLLTSLLRQNLSHHFWRSVHWLSYALAVCSVVHALMMSTNDQPGLRMVTVVCAAMMASMIGWRLVSGSALRRRRQREGATA